ncbi:MAG: hypothetical protein ABIP15_10025 [Devosia sp.]
MLRDRWWLGLLVGFVGPIASVPVSYLLMRSFGNSVIIGVGMWLVCLGGPVAGPFLIFRRVRVALLTAIAYVPVLLLVLVVLMLVLGCAMLPRTACI